MHFPLGLQVLPMVHAAPVPHMHCMMPMNIPQLSATVGPIVLQSAEELQPQA
jgi:hypothetical protein